MKKNSVDIRSGFLFPWHFLVAAAVVFVVALPLLLQRPVLATVLAAVSAFVLTGYEGVQVDMKRKTFREYRSFFFIKGGKWIAYDAIEKVYVSVSKVTQKVYTAHTNHSSVFANIEFNGYLKFNNGTKVHLFSRRNKEKLLVSLRKLAHSLGVPLEDNVGQPVDRV